MALVSIDNLNCGTKLGIWKKEEELELLESVFELNKQEKSEYSKITNEARKKEWLICRILLTELLEKRVILQHNENGKPFIRELVNDVTISHSKNFVCIIVANNEFAGIDIEQVSERVSKVSHKFLNNDELAWSTSLEQKTACWSAKEAVFKLHEKELDFHDMLIEPFNLNDDYGKFKLSVIKKGREGDYLIYYRKIENDILTYSISKSALAI